MPLREPLSRQGCDLLRGSRRFVTVGRVYATPETLFGDRPRRNCPGVH